MNGAKFVGLAAVLAVMLVSYGAANAQTEPLSTDTVGGLSIKTVFKHKGGTEEVNSFKTFTQKSGYRIDKNELPSFTLTGGVSDDKPMLYYVTDRLWESHMGNNDYKDFDVDVYIKKGSKVLRHLSYTDCNVAGYSITTLFDGDETYSGKTQFVIADSFDFDCRGYKPYSPLYESLFKPKSPY
ncbi:MAG TPA: hypothetical protein VNK44_01655 [Candidatus Nitrosotenuis sp.]|nr:hypothetical protein [Candidatus Nitrosotenuis sp.]